MASKRIYSIFDKVAEEYGPLFLAVNDGVAMRAFNKDMPREIGQNINDYVLVCVGLFNIGNGTISSFDTPGVVEEKVDA